MAKRRARRSTSHRARVSGTRSTNGLPARAACADCADAWKRFAFPATIAFMVLVHHLRRLQPVGARLHEHQGGRQHQRRRYSGCCSSSPPSSSPGSTRGMRQALGPSLADLRAGLRGGRPPMKFSPVRPHRSPLPGLRRADARHHHLGQPADPQRHRLLRRWPVVLRLPERHGDRRRLHVGRDRSSASPASSPCTATTASCTRSASSSPGWWRCCWWPSCCATRASTRWPTCWRSGCANARCVRRRRLDHGRVDLLPAGPDGRRGRAGGPAARHQARTTFLGMDASPRRSPTIILIGA